MATIIPLNNDQHFRPFDGASFRITLQEISSLAVTIGVLQDATGFLPSLKEKLSIWNALTVGLEQAVRDATHKLTADMNLWPAKIEGLSKEFQEASSSTQRAEISGDFDNKKTQIARALGAYVGTLNKHAHAISDRIDRFTSDDTLSSLKGAAATINEKLEALDKRHDSLSEKNNTLANGINAIDTSTISKDTLISAAELGAAAKTKDAAQALKAAATLLAEAVDNMEKGFTLKQMIEQRDKVVGEINQTIEQINSKKTEYTKNAKRIELVEHTHAFDDRKQLALNEVSNFTDTLSTFSDLVGTLGNDGEAMQTLSQYLRQLQHYLRAIRFA